MNAPKDGLLRKSDDSESLSLGDLALDALSLSLEDFLHDHPDPYLISEVGEATSGMGMFQTVSAQPRCSESAEEWAAYCVTKSERNGFKNMITVGRASNNDIVLDEPSVSKFHAYLKVGPKGWLLCDAGSKYGTALNGIRIASNKPVELESGALVSLGTGFVLAFHTPEALYNLLRALRAVGKL